nr:hypothetical protein [Tanacetum cinerariifolium]
RFNFSRYIFDSLVRNVDSSFKFYMYPRFIQLIIQAQVVDLSSHTTCYISPALTQKVFANMRRVGKGFSGVETPLFENMMEVREVDAEEEVQVSAQDDVDQENVTEEIADDVAQPTSPLPPSPVIPSSPPHQSPRPPPPQAAEGSSLLVQQVLDKCSEELDKENEESFKKINWNTTFDHVQAKDVQAKGTQKVHVVNYEIVMINNKPRYKIIREDDTHQLYTSFVTLLKNFDREDLEDLWKIVKTKFSTSKPTNFSDDYLLVTLKTMFEKTYAQDVTWRSQQTEYGQAW